MRRLLPTALMLLAIFGVLFFVLPLLRDKGEPYRQTPSASAMAERAKALKLPIPYIQSPYQSIMLEVGDSYVTIRSYCYKGTLIFTTAKGEPFGAAGGACALKSH